MDAQEPLNIPGMSEEDLAKLKDQIAAASAAAQDMVEQFLDAQPDAVRHMMDPLNLGPAYMAMSRQLLKQPERLMETQIAFWQGFAQLMDTHSRKAAGEDVSPVVEPERGDKRFRGDAWQKHAPFDFLKQAYLMASEAVMGLVSDVSGLDSRDQAKVRFFTKQLLDAISPSNFLFTNPEVLEATIADKGQNLVRGMQNFMEDVERGNGLPLVKMVDLDAFEVGENLATTPGKVVFQNRIFQLIQYSPTTKTVYETPLVIFPPWINKYYILDLSAEKSFVRWAVAQGFTVFIVSWVNPDSRYRDVTLDDYVREGYLEAFGAVKAATGSPDMHVIGYCVAGTALAAVLALLHARGEAEQIKSATFFTAQVDFSEAGDLALFTDDKQIAMIDSLMADKGYLDKRAMALTFNMLRSNDLIWSYVVNNYLMGREPMAFDLLYWNCDSTNMPRALHNTYLRDMYRDNKLVEPGAITLDGTPIDLSLVKTPTYIQAGREDHIAPPQSVYKMRTHFSGPVRFMLAGSGHIAGVVNPPDAKKYQHWTYDGDHDSYDDFVAKATEHAGSWWPDWLAWLKPQSGKKVTARQPGDGKLDVIEDAPGAYVKVKGD